MIRKHAAGRPSLVLGRPRTPTVLLSAQEAQDATRRESIKIPYRALELSLQCLRLGCNRLNVPHLDSSPRTSGSASSAGAATFGTRSPSVPDQGGGSSRSKHSALQGNDSHRLPSYHHSRLRCSLREYRSSPGWHCQVWTQSPGSRTADWEATETLVFMLNLERV